MGGGVLHPLRRFMCVPVSGPVQVSQYKHRKLWAGGIGRTSHNWVPWEKRCDLTIKLPYVTPHNSIYTPTCLFAHGKATTNIRLFLAANFSFSNVCNGRPHYLAQRTMSKSFIASAHNTHGQPPQQGFSNCGPHGDIQEYPHSKAWTELPSHGAAALFPLNQVGGGGVQFVQREAAGAVWLVISGLQKNPNHGHWLYTHASRSFTINHFPSTHNKFRRSKAEGASSVLRVQNLRRTCTR
jgi:hypothetical protein